MTRATLDDLERFSAAHGKFRYCSCQRWRLRPRDFPATDRPAALTALVEDEQPVGVLAYRRGAPVGWCSVAPRAGYAAITASRTLPAPPGSGVWAVTCFFIAPAERGHGLPRHLLAGACRYAKQQGALAIEAYPWPGGSSYFFMGTRALYEAAGFEDVAVSDGFRPLMRKRL